MRRYGNLFKDIVTIDNLKLAEQKAAKGKHNRKSVMKIEANLDNKLHEIQESLLNKTFTTSPYTLKTIYEPKQRDIYILPFYPDRIVQHALMNIVSPIWESMFINDTYACLKGRGQHKGSSKLMSMMKGNTYCLKCDIRKYYPSINHEIMFNIIQRKIKCPDTLLLLKNIIDSVESDANIPIGNYTSQWMGNLYLNELDQYLKHEHKVKNYIRYCDDFILLSDDKDFLREMRDVVKDFVAERLKMSLSKCDLFPLSQGVDFLGYRHFPKGYVLLRKSTAKRVKRRIKLLRHQKKNNKISNETLTSSVASTMGWLRWANTHNLKLALEIDALWKECLDGR